MYFKFEEDFVEAKMRCIPMIVRFKLDACGIKLKLAEWSRLTAAEREEFAVADCETSEEVAQYQNNLQQLILARTGNSATEFPVEKNPAWSNIDEIPQSIREKLAENPAPAISLEQWQHLTDLQRFVLVKLSNPGHENKNFSRAIAEFALL